MTYRLTATITHKSFDNPVIKDMYYTVDSKDELFHHPDFGAVPEHMIHNLKHYNRASFKDARGVKHKWLLEVIDGLN